MIDLVSGIGMGKPSDKAKDILGRVYEYFLGGFAGSEGKRGSEFYTPRSMVLVLVASRSGLRLVYRGVRHARSEEAERSPWLEFPAI